MFVITITNDKGHEEDYDLASYEYRNGEEFLECYCFLTQTENGEDWKVTRQDCCIPGCCLDFTGKQPNEDELDEAIEIAWDYDDLTEEQQIMLEALVEDRYEDDFRGAYDAVTSDEVNYYNKDSLSDIAQERFEEGFYFPDISEVDRERLSSYIDFDSLASDYEESYSDWLTPDNNDTCGKYNCCLEIIRRRK